MKALILLIFGLASSGLAQDFFTPLENHPGLLQAKLGLEAAQAQLRALQSPLALQAGGNLTRYDLAPAAAACTDGSLTPIQVATDPRCVAIPNQSGANLTLALTPFAFGDNADLIAQAGVGVEQASLGVRQARTSLEAQAIEAAYRLRLSQGALTLAQAVQKLSQANLEATQLRAERTAASPADVRVAELGLRQAQNQVQDAQRNLSLAQQNLADLVGSATAPPDLKVPQALTPPAIRQAELQVLLAQINYSKALRAIFPVLQGSFTRNTSPNDSLTLSLDSKALQPSLTYSYQDPARTLPGSRIDNIYQLRLSANLSFALVDALQAGQAQIDAAQQGIELAKRNTALQENALRSALQSAELGLSLAQNSQADADKNLVEARERERLGLTSPLSTLQAELTLAQAGLGLEQAVANRVSRILDLYRFYAQPISQSTK